MKSLITAVLCIVFLLGFAQNEKRLQEIVQKNTIQKQEGLLQLQAYKEAGKFLPEGAEKGFVGFYENGIPIFTEINEDKTNQSMNVDQIWNLSVNGTNYTLNGGSMNLYIWDQGKIRETHQEFMVGGSSRVVNIDNSPYQDHSTAVAGMAGALGVNAMAKGVAPNVNIMARDYTDFQMEIPSVTDAKVSNHSYSINSSWRPVGNEYYFYGDYSVSQSESNLNGNYNAQTVFWDETAYNMPEHIIVKSAGNSKGEGPSGNAAIAYVYQNNNWVHPTGGVPSNDCANGYDCLYAENTAKNILVVGAVNHLPTSDNRYSSPSDINLYAKSSVGPRDDGGIKPDVVSIGVDVFAPGQNSNNQTYFNNYSGTSFSAPAVAGVMVLLDELYFQEYDAYMPSALAKALIVNSAYEAGANIGPDYEFGWGLVNALGAATTIVNDQVNAYMEEETLQVDSIFELPIKANGNEPLKVTISWLDPAAEPILNSLNDRTSRLVNDLDLKVIDVATNEEILAWKLNPDNPASAATKGDNTVDNVEQVQIDAPTVNGNYKIVITHKGTLKDENGGEITSTNFGLVVSGAVSTLGVSDVDKMNHDVAIYPNPVKDQLFFKTKSLETLKSISIFDAQGKLIIYQNENLETPINLAHLQSGRYQIIFHFEGNKLSRGFIKR